MEKLTQKIERFPHAILHFDGDSFFASVEQAMDYRLCGKVVITGGERGAVTSVSKEGKARGLSRGMSLREIRIICPEAVIVPGDYISYAIYAHRMYDIVRSYTSEVEEYSIDECFADITGLERSGRAYEDIARAIKTELEDSLGITFGVGLACTKTLAKAASKSHKPAGFTSVPFDEIQAFTSALPIHYIWGLGGASGTKLEKLGAPTALDFAEKDDAWLSMHHLGKAYRDVWLELRGSYIRELGTEPDDSAVGSLMTTRTWKPPSTDRLFILAQLSKNIERVCEKARAHEVRARGLSFYLKTQEFTYHNVSLELALPVSNPSEVMKHVYAHLNEIYAPGVPYRASGIALRRLVPERAVASDLFGESLEAERRQKLFKTVDALNKRYGKQTLHLGSSMRSLAIKGNESLEVEHTTGKKKLQRAYLNLGIARRKKTLSLPYLGMTR